MAHENGCTCGTVGVDGLHIRNEHSATGHYSYCQCDDCRAYWAAQQQSDTSHS